jgi:hypothetical protein
MLAKYWSDSLNGRDHLKDLGTDGSIITIAFGAVGWEVVY